MSVEETILKRIKRGKKGTIYFTEDFHGEFSQESVRLAFHRLVNKGEVYRLANGIYVRPEVNSYIGPVLPTAEDIAWAIAKRDQAKIIPSGALALNLLGLSTQVPLNLVYLTDASPRMIKVGNRSIKFKKVAPKNLSTKGEISGLAIQALKTLGKEKLDPDRENRLIEVLKKEDQKHLIHDAKLAPEWIRKVFKKAMKS
ncbi:DUF6088 family protein [Reichenbachiella ulvae]|uniref:DUF6088 family protein n=1 Tax=Reichenbachiella ulvae TaxID=2980104 RepID=A0ABT3CUQ3_9BACT|nr:DUF6088 family protein [Reichenbachiella ulvae]MCV9387426.1 DUF6088 family protein [Reichenbachiella ulvae]